MDTVQRAATRLAESRIELVRPPVHWTGARIHALRGDWDTAEQHLGEASAAAHHYEVMLVPSCLARAHVAEARGDYDRVIEALAADRGDSLRIRDHMWGPADHPRPAAHGHCDGPAPDPAADAQAGRRRRHLRAAGATGAPPAGSGRPYFAASRPDQSRAADMTYVRPRSGWAYVTFALDVYSRMVVGWQVANHIRTELPLGALEVAL